MLLTVLLEADTAPVMNGFTLIAGVVGSVVTLAGSYFINVRGKQIDANSNLSTVKMETLLASTNAALVEATAELKSSEETIRALNVTLQGYTEELKMFESKFESLNVAFGIIFRQYEKDFKDDPSKLDLLSEIKILLSKEAL